MIIGMAIKNTELEKVLSLLENSAFNFYLTGSRAFGTSTENSDYDFFVQNNTSIESWLSGNGADFEDAAYDTIVQDVSLISIYKFKKANVHIQIVKNYVVKQAAQNYLINYSEIYPEVLNQLKDKFVRVTLWNMAFDVSKLIDVPISSIQEAQIYSLAKINKINAIKLYKDITGKGLKVSKVFVDALMAKENALANILPKLEPKRKLKEIEEPIMTPVFTEPRINSNTI